MKKGYIIILTIPLVLLVVITFFLGDKPLDLKDDMVTSSYKILGEADNNHCGGLKTYNSRQTTASDIDLESKLCETYYYLNEADFTTKTIKSNKTKDKTPICEVGEVSFLADDNKTCSYEIISKDTLNAKYKDLYGEDITDNEKFAITTKKTCYLEGDSYYCGNPLTYDFTIVGDATIYRMLAKATLSKQGTLTIYDYYLKVNSDNQCFLSLDSTTPDETCTKALENSSIDGAFLKKYAAKYKHTFNLNEDKSTYHFVSSIQE